MPAVSRGPDDPGRRRLRPGAGGLPRRVPWTAAAVVLVVLGTTMAVSWSAQHRAEEERTRTLADVPGVVTSLDEP